MSSDEEAGLGFVQILNHEGVVVGEPDPTLTNDLLVRMMQDMVKARVFDEWMLKIHPLGMASRYAPCEGQEASMIGSVYSTSSNDWLFPTYREYPVALARGVPLTEIMHRMFANSKDPLKGHEITLFGDRRYRIVIGAGGVSLMAPVAVGMAMASVMKSERDVFFVYLGDGATSKGDFHEAINWAGVFKTPVVFFVQNNQWAISVPFSRQTASQTIAVKAKAYGIPGVRVDGNDVMAVYTACRKAVDRARNRQGPTLVEAVTYRMGPHTTADDPTRYRSEEEVAEWRRRDPVKRIRNYLSRNGLWSENLEKQLTEDFKKTLRQATEEAEKTPPLKPTSIFEDVYSSLPWHLAEEMDELS
ncbi:MAG: thiamine pyrophosphate-dependent dehydrogenase E1 component subunit alpha [Candidatus Caldarchaeum sp.]|nr:thiamine pyrophosphate-dependent dehydrogenase E1 component subunit alpha [Candidatus Caldarchaeum sp.]